MYGPPKKIGRHPREPWRPEDPAHIWVHARLAEVQGIESRPIRYRWIARIRYAQAKLESDAAAAGSIVDRFINDGVVSLIVDRVIAARMPALVVMPFPEFDSGGTQDPRHSLPMNMIPSAFANRLARVLGCEVGTEILETARPGRSKLELLPRFLWQPSFAGRVRPDRSYVLVDDVSSLGGTLAALRSHIVAHGGTVVAATALASHSGEHQNFPIADDAVRVLKGWFSLNFDEFWRAEIGHGPQCLTAVEGAELIRFAERWCGDCGPGEPALQFLRTRLAETAAGTR